MMKSFVTLGAVVLALASGCGEKGPAHSPGPAEKAGESLDEAGHSAKENTKDAAEKAGDAVKNAGDKVEDATDR